MTKTVVNRKNNQLEALMSNGTLTIDLDAIKSNWLALDKLSADTVETAAVVKANALALEHFPETVRDVREVVLAAVLNNWEALKSASLRLQSEITQLASEGRIKRPRLE